jgi:hypothetical protein
MKAQGYQSVGVLATDRAPCCRRGRAPFWLTAYAPWFDFTPCWFWQPLSTGARSDTPDVSELDPQMFYNPENLNKRLFVHCLHFYDVQLS